MVVSQNGWSANDRSVIASYSLPGGSIALRKGDVSVVLLWCFNQWHRNVEPLVWPGIWGYAERLVRGGEDVSNHASGTAGDANAPKHPLGTSPRANFTDAQIAEVHKIVAFCEGVVRWGGDYTGRKDGMHIEINAGATAVKRIADKIRALNGTQPTSTTTVTQPVTSRKSRGLPMIENHVVSGSGTLRLICPTGPVSVITDRAWISAVAATDLGGIIRGWFQSDSGGISEFDWKITVIQGRSQRVWAELPPGTTQVNLQYSFGTKEQPGEGTICLEASPK